MHDTAKSNAKKFVDTYCKNMNENTKVVEFGSAGDTTIRSMFPSVDYKGIDMSTGLNVDIVCNNRNTPFETESINIVVSSSCFEHDKCFWMSFLEMCRIVKPSGYIYICVPSEGPYHGYPGDCWRFYKDSWEALKDWAKENNYSVSIVESYIHPNGIWRDNICVFQKD